MAADPSDQALAGVDPSFLPLIDGPLLRAAFAAIEKKGDLPALMPPPGRVFECLRYGSAEGVSGVILAQDPYPQGAEGLCLAKGAAGCPGGKLPASFKPIAKCLEARGLLSAGAPHADLRPWAAQGVLLLNMALTTRAGARKAHQAIWRPFVREFLARLNRAARRRGARLFYLAWGDEAKNGAAPAARHGHEVFAWTHPSPMADNKLGDAEKFVNCDGFARANALLGEIGRPPIVWDIMSHVFAFADGACPGNGRGATASSFGVAIAGGHLGPTFVRGRLEPRLYALADPADPAAGFGPVGSDVMPHTNNRAELLAICWALRALLVGCAVGRLAIVSDAEPGAKEKEPPVIELHSDSRNAVKTFNEWLPKRRAKGKEMGANRDLVNIAEKLLITLRARAASVALIHVPASHDHPRPAREAARGRARFLWEGNARADRLANEALTDAAGRPTVSSPIGRVAALT